MVPFPEPLLRVPAMLASISPTPTSIIGCRASSPRVRVPVMRRCACLFLLCLSAVAAQAADLVIADAGATTTTVVVSAHAGPWEKRAAEDLVRCIALMTGAKPALADAAGGAGPTILVGAAALEAEPSLRQALARVAKPAPLLRADAIVQRRVGERVYLAGSNDESHYFAVTRLLQSWGCRWYLPSALGECIPETPRLTIGDLDLAYAPPFEIRHYWLSWNADGTGADDFRRRNFMTETSMAGMGHALGQYTTTLIPAGKTPFDVPLADEATAQEVARRIEPEYAKGVPGISLAIEDGNYRGESPRDHELAAGLDDKFALQPSRTDAMMALYNNVARLLRARHPDSPTRIGGMAYANVTIPPQQVTAVEPNLVMWLAPIDIDPNHGMDDPESPPAGEYKAMLYRWARLTAGRLAIYDYDQGQLVWRDLPDPSHAVFAADVKHYRTAGILGIGTESRGATATTFLNLYFRGQLMWDPDADVAALLAAFYPAFYGPAAAPMADYWGAIYAAWQGTLVTEHECFAAPAIYTPELVAALRAHLARADAALAPLRAVAAPTRNQKLYLERLRSTALGFAVIEGYVEMTAAASARCEYAAAVAAGERALAAREKLTALEPTATTYKAIGESGPAWWPGEVQYLRELAQRCDGTTGTFISALPLAWAFRRDPHDTGLARGWYAEAADLTLWNARGTALDAAARKDWPDAWELVRSDLYLQAQGIRHPDRQSYTGHYWYQTTITLGADQVAGDVHLMFPGLFNECWLYLDDRLVAHRPFPEPWWRNDYTFAWDVDLKDAVKPGPHRVTLRGLCPLHFGGMFRRPFLYRAVVK